MSWLASLFGGSSSTSRADSLNQRGGELYQKGQYREAAVALSKARDLYRKAGDHEGELVALGNLGTVLHIFGQYRESLAAHEECLSLARGLRDRRREGKALGDIGSALLYLNDTEGAIHRYQEHLAIAREVGDHRGESMALGNLGHALFVIGRYQESIEYQKESLGLARKIRDRSGEAMSLITLGVAYQAVGDYLEAIRCEEEGLKLGQEIGDPTVEVYALGNLANIRHTLGESETAVGLQERVLELVRQLGDIRGETQALTELGKIYLYVGRSSEAEAVLDEALQIARSSGSARVEGIVLSHLGNLGFLTSQYEKAIRFFGDSLKVKEDFGDRLGIGTALTGLGNSHLGLGELDRAREYFVEALTVYQEVNEPNGVAIGETALGIVYLLSGEIEKAAGRLTNAVEKREALRARLGPEDLYKVSLFERQTSSYDFLEKALVLLGRERQALEVAERGRARSLVELMERRLSRGRLPQSHEIAPSQIEEILRIAREQEAPVIEYSLLRLTLPVRDRKKEVELLIWVVQPDGTIQFRRRPFELPPALRKQVSSSAPRDVDDEPAELARDLVGVGERRLESEILRFFYQELIEPIEQWLPREEGARVVLIPQHFIHLVPFAALRDSSGRFLVDRFAFSFAPSIQSLGLARRQRQRLPTSKGSALVVGNPTLPAILRRPGRADLHISPLPGAAEEARDVAELIGVEPLLGHEATKTTVLRLLPHRGLIHFATHGLLDDGPAVDLPGAIALAPSGEDDGILTAGEIAQLDLTAELVVLSACNTGQGRTTTDGIIGLSRAFLTAGVPSLVVSLWSIPDTPTARLMTAFYSGLRQGLDKAQALRQAMREIRRDYPDPIEWGAFLVLGEV